MEGVYTLLNELKIKCFFRGNYKKQKPNWNPTYLVRIDGNINVKRWFELIGSKNPKHITKFQIWKEFGFCPPYTTLEDRKKILKAELNPNIYYNAEMPEWSNGHEFLKLPS